MKDHWNSIYAGAPLEQLGWYEAVPEGSLQLLDACRLAADDPVLDVGAGASTFIDHLLAAGFQRVIATDISEVALGRLRERLGPERASQVRWILDDVTAPTDLLALQDVALWHDRALLHFFVDEAQRQAYLETLKRLLRPGGYVILAAFSLEGARRCSGLDVRNYDAALLGEYLGQEFRLVDGFDYLYHTPGGAPRPYVYALFQRVTVGP